MELAIINGTYRDSSAKAAAAAGMHFLYLLLYSLQFLITNILARIPQNRYLFSIYSSWSNIINSLLPSSPYVIHFHIILFIHLSVYNERLLLACDEEWRRVAQAAAETQRLLSPAIPGLATPMRNPSAPLGAPLILSPRMSVPTTAASILNGSAPPGSLLSPGDPHGLIYTPYADYTNYAALASPLLTEYATADHSGGLFARWRAPLVLVPYVYVVESPCDTSNLHYPILNCSYMYTGQ